MKTDRGNSGPDAECAASSAFAGSHDPQGAPAPSASAGPMPEGESARPAYVRDAFGQFAPGTAGRQRGCRNRENRLLDEVFSAPLPPVVAAGGPLVEQTYRATLYRAMKGDEAARMEVLRLQRARHRKPRTPGPSKMKGGRGFKKGRFREIMARLERVRI